MRTFLQIQNFSSDFEAKLEAWTSMCEVACVLKSNSDKFAMADQYSKFEICVALDSIQEIKNTSSAFDALKNFHQTK